jgi:DNA-binding winged helix-turn-helix (wHTH) protein
MRTDLIPMLEPERKESSESPAEAAPRYLRFGAFQLDNQRQELFKNGSRVKLQGKALQVLLTLLERPGEVVTREELRLRLWALDTHVNFEANVNTTVNKLRQALGDSSGEALFIETIPRKGYSFVAAVERTNLPVTAPVRPQAHAAVAAPSTEPEPLSGKQALFRSVPSSVWVTVGVIVLVLAGMLLGAGIATFWIYHLGHSSAFR